MKLKIIPIDDLTPAHKLPSAGQDLEAGDYVTWNDQDTPIKIWKHTSALSIGMARHAAKRDNPVQIHPLKFGTAISETEVLVNPLGIGQPDYGYVLVIEEDDSKA